MSAFKPRVSCQSAVLLTVLCLLTSSTVASAQTTKSSSVVEVVRAAGQIGAGVQVRPGLILTAAHVVASDPSVAVVDEARRDHAATVVSQDRDLDLALIQIDDSAIVEVTPISCAEPALGSRVTLVGHPYGRLFVRSLGHVISQAEPIAAWASLITIDRDAFPGMSGGPVIGADGKVVALVVAATSYTGRPVGPAGAVPGDALCHFVNAYVEARVRLAGL